MGHLIVYHIISPTFFPQKSTQAFPPECHKSHFYTLTSNPFLNLNTISSFAFTITSCTRLLQIPASNSSIKPSYFSKVRMNPLNNSLFTFLLSICSAMSSYLAVALSYLAVSGWRAVNSNRRFIQLYKTKRII